MEMCRIVEALVHAVNHRLSTGWWKDLPSYVTALINHLLLGGSRDIWGPNEL